jgi:manganese transport protein
VDPTWALIISQVILSFGIAFALIPLIIFTTDSSLMGVSVNKPLTSVLAIIGVTIVIVINMALLYVTFFGG